MLSNILAVSAELQEQGYPKFIGIPEAALYALIGFTIVFLGIAFLIGIVYAVGKVLQIQKDKTLQTKKAEISEKVASETVVIPTTNEEEISDETVAVITAAIMAYYEQTNPKCEFTVRRIKRI